MEQFDGKIWQILLNNFAGAIWQKCFLYFLGTILRSVKVYCRQCWTAIKERQYMLRWPTYQWICFVYFAVAKVDIYYVKSFCYQKSELLTFGVRTWILESCHKVVFLPPKIVGVKPTKKGIIAKQNPGQRMHCYIGQQWLIFTDIPSSFCQSMTRKLFRQNIL